MGKTVKLIPDLRRKFMIRPVDTKMRGGASGQGDDILVATATTKQRRGAKDRMWGDGNFSGEAGRSNTGDLEETIREVIGKCNIVREIQGEREFYTTWDQRTSSVKLDFSLYQFNGHCWSLRMQFQGQVGMETKFLQVKE